MPLKWKLRLYYGVLIVVLLVVLGGATAGVVLDDFRREIERRESEAARFTRRLFEERMAAVDSAVARAARDPELLLLARRDLASSREQTLADWVPLATRLSRQHALPLLKILDAEGRVLSSAHWPAAYDLTDSPGLVLALEAGTGTRLVRERDASGEFLALEAPRWLPPSRRYVVIGGLRADAALENEVSERASIPLRFVMLETAVDTGPDSQPVTLDHGPWTGDLSWVALPTSPVEPLGGVQLEFDRSSLAALRRRLAQIFGLAVLAGTMLAWLLGWWMSNRVTRPLESLADGVAVLAEGRTPHPIRLQGSGELRDLVASFNRMAESLAESRDRLRRAERIAAWREVARRVAHEIKNALAPIQLSVDNVARSLETGRGDLKTLVAESATMVRGEVEALTRLVNAFNEMARLPEPEPIPRPLSETWERAAAPFRDQMHVETNGIDALPVILHDGDQIRRVLHNLLLNASEAGARTVRVNAMAAPRGYYLEVRDDGPGVAEEDLGRLFEPYFTRKGSGTGLGLAIVYKICADHGWTVAASSPADASAPAGRRGTVFTISIPTSSVATDAAP